MKKTISLVILLLTFQLSSEEATTKNGRKVILNSDFTWKYATEVSRKNEIGNASAIVILTKSEEQDTELKSQSGEFSLWYNSKKWNRPLKHSNKMSEFEFENRRKTGYSMIIFETLEIPLESFPELLVINARAIDPGASLLEISDCKVNGKTGKLVKYSAVFDGRRFIFYSFVTSNKRGSIQFTTYTLESHFDSEKEEFEKLLSGLQFFQKSGFTAFSGIDD
ncbi:DUF3157 family protein [Leptospira sp. WS92.C1]